ncbi:MAG: hypothetical protein AMJ41_00755 [candidate division Zixibacteria bacterium DG_27]|nr:MAG: hypothetical protein AMJ41_00755 [candidate division Zixibacteria bacterium DG_27]
MLGAVVVAGDDEHWDFLCGQALKLSGRKRQNPVGGAHLVKEISGVDDEIWFYLQNGIDRSAEGQTEILLSLIDPGGGHLAGGTGGAQMGICNVDEAHLF